MAEPLTHRLVAVIEKRQESGPALNAVAHMAAGLAALLAKNGRSAEARFNDYSDANGNIYPSISDHPFIVLSGKGGEIRRLVAEANEQAIPCVVFLDTMTIGTFSQQHEKTAATKTEDLVFLGACLFGSDSVIREMTKRFSLWR